jgi:hypothetical protein
MSGLVAQFAQWRRATLDARITPDALDELEDHLRDDVEARIASGMKPQEAFTRGVARLGPADQLRHEFAKVPSTTRARLKTAWLTLAGIPHSYASSHMNTTNPTFPLEPRWATYTKAALFLSPALLLSVFSVLVLLPRLHMICQQAGIDLPWVFQAIAFIADHPLLTSLLVIAPFALLEWRWSGWPRFRRISLGGTVFILNATVLTLLATAVVFALIAAPNFARQ